MTDQSKNQSLTWEPVCFTGFIYQSKNDLKTAVILTPNPTWVTAHESWEPITYYRIFRQLNGLGSVLCWYFSRSSFVPHNTDSLCFFSASKLVWQCLSAVHSAYVCLGKQVLVNLLSFREFLYLSIAYILSLCPYMMDCFTLPSLCLSEHSSKMEGLNVRSIFCMTYAHTLHIYVYNIYIKVNTQEI